MQSNNIQDQNITNETDYAKYLYAKGILPGPKNIHAITLILQYKTMGIIIRRAVVLGAKILNVEKNIPLGLIPSLVSFHTKN